MGILAERIKGEQLGSVGDSRVETGLSQMEGSEVAQRFHHADAQSFALSVLFVGLGIVGNLPGGLLYAFDPGSRRLKSSG